ncbi:MAG: hypothetical protein HY814_11085 [Candidatus Riflebacteria bacterium]|nr:hypothetical protein [Candidatus Riflebacteria bacterium]
MNSIHASPSSWRLLGWLLERRLLAPATVLLKPEPSSPTAARLDPVKGCWVLASVAADGAVLAGVEVTDYDPGSGCLRLTNLAGGLHNPVLEIRGLGPEFGERREGQRVWLYPLEVWPERDYDLTMRHSSGLVLGSARLRFSGPLGSTARPTGRRTSRLLTRVPR